MNDALHNLTELLRELPGIGPRQARRLAFWFARRDRHWVERFSRTVLEVRRNVRSCERCKRLFEGGSKGASECELCIGVGRDHSLLMLVEKDVDLENIERTGTYKGNYFVLGGTTSPLDKEPEKHVRIAALITRLKEDSEITEIIFALSATTEGEDTVTFVKERVQELRRETPLSISELGRGLSTGTELEYVDADTMKNALTGRH